MYFIYYNWTAKPNIGTIHHASCGNCKNGKGKIPNAVQGRNGQWSKSHVTLVGAETEVNSKEFTVAYCRCLKKK